MALEQKVETLHFTSGDGFESETLPREIFRSATLLSLEPEQIPFLLTGTTLFGYHDLGEQEGQPVRRTILGLSDPKQSKRFAVLSDNAQPIPVYNSPQDALFELQPRVLPYQRENTDKLMQTLASENGTLRFSNKEYRGAISFHNGKAARATMRTPKETLYGEPALIAFLLLFSYQPLRFDERGTETRRLAPDSASVVEPLAASALPAYAHTLREKLEQRGLDNYLFNVERENGTYSRVSGPNYAVSLRFSGVPVGLLRFKNGAYYDGEVKLNDGSVTGDEALHRALALSESPEVVFARPRRTAELLEIATVGGRATRSTLASTAHYFAQ